MAVVPHNAQRALRGGLGYAGARAAEGLGRMAYNAAKGALREYQKRPREESKSSKSDVPAKRTVGIRKQRIDDPVRSSRTTASGAKTGSKKYSKNGKLLGRGKKKRQSALTKRQRASVKRMVNSHVHKSALSRVYDYNTGNLAVADNERQDYFTKLTRNGLGGLTKSDLHSYMDSVKWWNDNGAQEEYVANSLASTQIGSKLHYSTNQTWNFKNNSANPVYMDICVYICTGDNAQSFAADWVDYWDNIGAGDAGLEHNVSLRYAPKKIGDRWQLKKIENFYLGLGEKATFKYFQKGVFHNIKIRIQTSDTNIKRHTFVVVALLRGDLVHSAGNQDQVGCGAAHVDFEHIDSTKYQTSVTQSLREFFNTTSTDTITNGVKMADNIGLMDAAGGLEVDEQA